MTTFPSSQQMPADVAVATIRGEAQGRRGSLLRSSAGFAVVSVAAGLLSLMKAIVVAHYFGTTGMMDAFAIAVLVPNLLGVLVTGSSASALVPALAAAEQRGPEERARTFRASLTLVAATCVLLSILLVLLAGPIVATLASQFDPGRKLLAIGLLRWASPLLVFTAIYAFASGELLSRRRYAAVAGAPAVSTVVSLAIVVHFANAGVAVLVYGLLAGTALQALVVAWPAWRASALPGWPRLWTPAVRDLVRCHAPLLIASAVGVANTSVDQAIAGFLPAGNVSALNYAGTINTLVVQVVVMAASWVALPDMSQLAASGNLGDLAARARRWVAGITMVAAPVSALILTSGGFLIRILFQHGTFTRESTHLVFTTWAGYTVGLVAFSIGMMAVRLINVLNANHVLVALGAVSLPLNGLLDYLLMQRWGCFGISLSTSIIYFLTAAVKYTFLRRHVGQILDRSTWEVIFGSVLASAAAGSCLWVIRLAIPSQWVGIVLGIFGFAVVLASGYAVLGLVARTASGVTFLPSRTFSGMPQPAVDPESASA